MMMMRRTWKWRAGRRVELVTPPWHHRLIPSIPINICQWHIFRICSNSGLAPEHTYRYWHSNGNGGLSMAPGVPDQHHVTPRAAPPVSQGTLSTLDLATTVARGVAAAATQILERFAQPPQVNEADHPPIDLAADAAIWEHFQRCLATTPRSMPAGQAASGRISAFNRLGHWALAHQEENPWTPQPEMMPRKVDRGRQPEKEPESQWAKSQKHRSQSRPCDEANPKKGKTEGERKTGKIQVGIDWTIMGIQKPISKSDSRHPSFKSDVSGASSDQPPQMKSTMAKGSQKYTSGSHDRTSSQGGRSSHTVSDAQKGDPEKKELWDKSHRWIESRVKRLDPAGYMEEINSMRYFERNAGCFALQIVAIADWGRRYIDVGLKYPIPTFSTFLFTPLPESHQAGWALYHNWRQLSQLDHEAQCPALLAWGLLLLFDLYLLVPP